MCYDNYITSRFIISLIKIIILIFTINKFLLVSGYRFNAQITDSTSFLKSLK